MSLVFYFQVAFWRPVSQKTLKTNTITYTRPNTIFSPVQYLCVCTQSEYFKTSFTSILDPSAHLQLHKQSFLFLQVWNWTLYSALVYKDITLFTFPLSEIILCCIFGQEFCVSDRTTKGSGGITGSLFRLFNTLRPTIDVYVFHKSITTKNNINTHQV